MLSFPPMTPDAMTKAWVVYYLYDAMTAELIYTGHCQFVRLPALPDVKGLVGFDPSLPVMLQIHSFHETRQAAHAQQTRLRSGALNRSRYVTRHAWVECVETGERWPTAREAALAHGLAAPALSNHLNGNLSYRTVKGRTYRRVAANGRE